MSAKRSASYNIDPHTLEQIEKDNEQRQQKEASKQIEARKIFKIKRPGAVQMAQSKQTKVSFKLNSSQQFKNSNQTEQQAAKKQAIAINPFQNLFKQNEFNGIGIFSNLKSTNLFKPNDKIQQDFKNVISTNNGQTNIFGSLNKGTSIFSNNNINTIKNTSASLFSNNNTTLTNNYEQQGSGDSAQLQNDQKLQINPDKSSNTYNYGDSCPILLTLKALKFKKKGREIVENVQVVLQKDKQIRIPATKKSIYSGIIVENRSQAKHFNNKNQNVQVSSFSKQKEGITKSILMFQFDKDQQGQMFFERLNELLKSSENQSQIKNDQKKQ